MLLAASYGLLALLAMWATARDFDLFWVGFWLLAGWLCSNLIFFLAPIEARAGPYTLIEMMVALAAYCGFVEHRSKWLIGILGLNAVSIAINVAFAAVSDPDHRQINLYEVTTNMCFAAQCLLAISVGVGHGRRTGRFTRWPLVRRHPVEQGAARQERRP